MGILNQIKATLQQKSSQKVQVFFAEGWNPIIQQAAITLLAENIIQPCLIFQTQAQAQAFKNFYSINSLVIETTDLAPYAHVLYQLRKDKGLSYQQAQELINQPPYLLATVVYMNQLCGGICGIEYTTRDTLGAAFRVLKPKKGVELYNSVMLLEKGEQTLYFADIGLVLDPNASELATITYNTLSFIQNTLKTNTPNNVALLSYSTNKSGSGASVTKVQEAYQLYLQKYPPFANTYVFGEIQFDAAIDASVRLKKCPNCPFQDNANVFIMPNLDAGNISYKIMQRIGGFEVAGPIILGMDKPINDLSRGAGLAEVLALSYITALQSIPT